jgi:hypothetical protein
MTKIPSRLEANDELELMAEVSSLKLKSDVSIFCAGIRVVCNR